MTEEAPGDSTQLAERPTDDVVRAAYDRVPYPSGVYREAHPDNLAVRAFLQGLPPVPLEGCRVLELGCADGGNLLPLAFEFPGSHCVGVDLSPVQIGAGRRRVAELGIGNLDLHARSLLDVDPGFGTFDYVLVHGVFSWVTAPVQEKILAICRANLSPHGVAYISYNTYPGWHGREMVRELMLYHTRNEPDLHRQAEGAIDLLRFLAEATRGRGDAHSQFLASTLEHLEEHLDQPSYLIHEYLEASNTPLYFHRFVERAAQHGLQYLGEADSDLLGGEGFRPAIAQRLQAFAADRIEHEQYLDFLRNRAFRRSLLCHAEAPLDPEPAAERVRHLHASTFVKPAGPASEPPDLAPGVAAAFRTGKEKSFTSSHPITKAALVQLADAWPAALSFDDLAAVVEARLGTSAEDVPTVLADVLHSLFSIGLVELHLTPPHLTANVSERPLATSLARAEAAAGRLVPSQLRRSIRMDDGVGRLLLTHLDGRHDRGALVDLLAREVAEGRLGIEVEGGAIGGPERLRAVLARIVEDQLLKMAGNGLLVG
ncbi:MAG TPA: class I SAM-dependent methyltransferase [Thermoanaerobaculia bacterium]|nr:class I SAM-dependent methyltransferase [Thermoanaerobaculia bacterium]